MKTIIVFVLTVISAWVFCMDWNDNPAPKKYMTVTIVDGYDNDTLVIQHYYTTDTDHIIHILPYKH